MNAVGVVGPRPSYDRICNDRFFSGISVKLVLLYRIGKVVSEYFNFCAKQQNECLEGLEYGENQGHFIMLW